MSPFLFSTLLGDTVVSVGAGSIVVAISVVVDGMI
jgi:hypothetical protein